METDMVASNNYLILLNREEFAHVFTTVPNAQAFLSRRVGNAQTSQFPEKDPVALQIRTRSISIFKN
jgi:hypothetical protein